MKAKQRRVFKTTFVVATQEGILFSDIESLISARGWDIREDSGRKRTQGRIQGCHCENRR